MNELSDVITVGVIIGLSWGMFLTLAPTTGVILLGIALVICTVGLLNSFE